MSNQNVVSSSSMNDLRAILAEVRAKIGANRRRQNLLQERKSELMEEATSLKADGGFLENRERIEEIQGVYAKTRITKLDENNEPMMDEDGEPVFIESRFRDEYGQWVMLQEGEITGIIRELSGFQGEPGLYQEYGELRKMEAALCERLQSMATKSGFNKIKGMEELQKRMNAAMGK
jgi:hypothetical protein